MAPLDDLHRFQTIAERDIDLLLLEELHVSAEFSVWFAQHGGLPDAERYTFAGAWHSVSEATLGESDLVFVMSEPSGKKHGILIENKIGADPQPRQAERYRLRGAAGVKRGDWDTYRTCLVAPEKYLQANRSGGYDFQLSYEQISGWYGGSAIATGRSAFKIMVIEAAIEQSRRGYRPEPDADVTAFFSEYYHLVLAECPDLGMREPGPVPAKSDWALFFPRGLAAGFRLRHKLRFGRVDLEMPDCGEVVEQVRQRNSGLLEGDMGVLQTAKSAAICISVPVIDRFGGFSGQLEAVRSGLSAACRLREIAGRVVWP